MRKFGVFILLTSFVISSLLILSNINTNSTTPYLRDKSLIKEEDMLTPEASNFRSWDYIPEEIAYDWEDLKSIAAQSYVKNITNLFSNKNNGYYMTQLPFWVRLYDNKFAKAYISTNGYLSLSWNMPDYSSNPEFPMVGADYSDIIAPFWDDIDLNRGGSVFIANLTDRWVLEYKNVYHYTNTEIGSFEVVLYKDGTIQFNYENIILVAEDYTLGINKGDGTYYVQFDVIQAFDTYRSFAFRNEFIVFEDDFEGGVKPEWSGVNTGNFWHITNKDNHSVSHSLWCANASSNTYEKYVEGVLQPVKQSVIIKNIDLKDYNEATLSFWFKKQTEASNWLDYVNVSARINSKHFYLSQRYTNYQHELFYINWEQNTWVFMQFNLSFFCGFDHIDIIFTFNTVDEWNNFHNGFKMDDVKINASKSFMPIFDQISISEGDEFEYYANWIDQWRYEDILGEWPIWDNEMRCKIEIKLIEEHEYYWEITARFWDWGEDFSRDGQSEEVKYYIYKFPINIKAGNDFFIPSNDVNGYLTSADNINMWQQKFIVQADWGAYNIELRFDSIAVWKNYNDRGILTNLYVQGNKWDYSGIYEIGLVDWEDEYNNDSYNDYNDEELYVNIPGYDVPIMIITIFATIIYTIKWIFKPRKR